jgi:hypothetical protein
MKRAVTELTLQHPNFSDFQIAQVISERFTIRIARPAINRMDHLAQVKFRRTKRSQNVIDVQKRQPYQIASDFINGKLPKQNLIFFDESHSCMGLDNRWM